MQMIKSLLLFSLNGFLFFSFLHLTSSVRNTYNNEIIEKKNNSDDYSVGDILNIVE